MDVREYIEKEFSEKDREMVTKIYEGILYPFMADVLKLKYEVEVMGQRLPSVIEKMTSLDVIKKGITVVDLYGEWCVPCFHFLPAIEKVANEFKGTAKFVKLDIDKNPEIVKEMGIPSSISIPLLIAYKDGKEIQRIQGCPIDEQKRVDLVRWMVKRAMVSDEEWEKTFNIMKKVAEAKGWILNPNQMVRDGLITALTWNKENLGNYYCPCKPEHIPENKCPCKPHDDYLGSEKAVEQNGICYCGLFVSKEYMDKLLENHRKRYEEVKVEDD